MARVVDEGRDRAPGCVTNPSDQDGVVCVPVRVEPDEVALAVGQVAIAGQGATSNAPCHGRLDG